MTPQDAEFQLEVSWVYIKQFNMLKAITGYHTDDENHWVAELQCGHFQHIRHQPPFINRPWVMTLVTRNKMLGQHLHCKKCDEKLT